MYLLHTHIIGIFKFQITSDLLINILLLAF